MRSLIPSLICLAGLGGVAAAQTVESQVMQELPALVQQYKQLHQQPELSHHEEKTSSLFAAQLRAAGFAVTEHVGRYPDGVQAFGVVGVLKNGPGKTLLIRTELDALPVVEQTGLPYASIVHVRNKSNQDVGVMHACGHDIHIATAIGTAQAMAALKAQWKGTLLVIGQPSEETIDGAKAMLADGLYERFGRPDYVIGLHDTSNFIAGQVSVVPGAALASSTSIDVIMRGVGAHGSSPERGKDPVVMAAEFIIALQTLVSRQIPPQKPAVVTVGDIHGGTKRNIIPDEVKMELTTRSYDETIRQTILAGIKRTADGIAYAAGVPADRMPIVTVVEQESTPVTYNDLALSQRLNDLFLRSLGRGNVIESPPIMASDDFGILNLDGKIPSVLYWLGTVTPEQMAESRKTGIPLPSAHSPFFAPAPEKTIQTGVFSMTTAALDLLSSR
ncbi:MAG TPA: amidohydrolase [Acidobacteriaceae bacterium]